MPSSTTWCLWLNAAGWLIHGLADLGSESTMGSTAKLSRYAAACRALDDRLTAPGAGPTVPEALQALAHGALLGARGNSGVILSQLLRGAAGAHYSGSAVDGNALGGAGQPIGYLDGEGDLTPAVPWSCRPGG